MEYVRQCFVRSVCAIIAFAFAIVVAYGAAYLAITAFVWLTRLISP